MQEFNGTPGDPHSYDRLDKLLDAQVYRLSHWKAAADEINYRRFFDINELAAVCMEDRRYSTKAIAWCSICWSAATWTACASTTSTDCTTRSSTCDVAGGLPAGPRQRTLRSNGRCRRRRRGGILPARATACWPHGTADGRAAAVGQIEPRSCAHAPHCSPIARGCRCTWSSKKFSAPTRPCPTSGCVAGTTGYDFLNSVGGLFVDPAGLGELTAVYNRFIDQRLDFREVAYQSKLLILRTAMSSELQLLAHRLNRISSATGGRGTSRSTRCGSRCGKSWPVFPSIARTSARGRSPSGTGR